MQIEQYEHLVLTPEWATNRIKHRRYIERLEMENARSQKVREARCARQTKKPKKRRIETSLTTLKDKLYAAAISDDWDAVDTIAEQVAAQELATI